MEKSPEYRNGGPTTSERKLEQLQEKILLAKGSREKKDLSHSHHRDLNYAWRMILELVIGMVIGLGIGLGLDHWLKTSPLMTVIMALFGFGAGVRTMMRTANEFSSEKKRT